MSTSAKNPSKYCTISHNMPHFGGIQDPSSSSGSIRLFDLADPRSVLLENLLAFIPCRRVSRKRSPEVLYDMTFACVLRITRDVL